MSVYLCSVYCVHYLLSSSSAVVAFVIIGRKKCKTGSVVVCCCQKLLLLLFLLMLANVFVLYFSGFKRSFNLCFCEASDDEFRLAA
jgi:hypothetical protein